MKKLLLIFCLLPSAALAGTQKNFKQINFDDGTVMTSTTGFSGGGGGVSVYNSTATAGFPFGFSASTGVFTSTITAQALIAGTTIQINQIQRNGSSNDRFNFLAGVVRLTVAAVQNTDFSSGAFFSGNAALNTTTGQATETFAPIGTDLEILHRVRTTPITQASFPYAAYYAGVNDDQLGGNASLFGNYSVPGRETYFFVAGATNTSCGASCAYMTPSTATFVINTAYGSSSYGFIGVNKSTPTVNLDVNGIIAASTITTQPGLTGVTVSTTLFVVSGSTQASVINSGLVVTGHISVSSSTPVLSSCGTSPSIVGNDQFGKITVGSGVIGTCTMTFAVPWPNAPPCQVLSGTVIASLAGTTTTTAFTFTGTSLTSDVVMYQCGGYQ